jgi:MFS family permease
MAFGGLSMGVFLPNLNLALLSRVSEGARGRALGGVTTSFYLGQFLSPFYSVPIGVAFGIGFAFEVTGYWLFAIAALFAGLAVAKRVAR